LIGEGHHMVILAFDLHSSQMPTSICTKY
jgi:hypothetical protein